MGLPSSVRPPDIRMMFATYHTLAITTYGEDVWVISQNSSYHGNNNTGNATTWYRVKTGSGASDFLTDIVACRGTNKNLFTLDKNDDI